MVTVALWLFFIGLDVTSALFLRTEVSRDRKIPNRLVFNYKANLLTTRTLLPKHSDNLNRSIDMYRDMEIEFLDDAGCSKAIETVHSAALAAYFEKETFGPYKSDLCRLAQLYMRGGYYMDNDLEVISDMRDLIPAKASFVTAVHPRWDVFQGIIAAAPGHPVLMKALNMTFEYYDRWGSSEGFPKVLHSLDAAEAARSRRFLGPAMLTQAFMWWANMARNQLPSGSVTHLQHQGEFKYSYFFVESNDIQGFGLASRQEPGCCCNYFVGDQRSRKAAMFSRFVGASTYCSR